MQNSWIKYEPTIPFEHLQGCDFRGMPKNGCSFYHTDYSVFYEYDCIFDSWKNVTFRYDWKTILKTNTMSQPVSFYNKLF